MFTCLMFLVSSGGGDGGDDEGDHDGENEFYGKNQVFGEHTKSTTFPSLAGVAVSKSGKASKRW